MSKGKLIVISGASGVGKSTVLSKVMENRDDLKFSVSATTRAPRPGEVEGKSYYFVTKEKFEEMIANKAFLEYDAHMDNYYGTPVDQIREKMETGDVILDIEPKGAAQVRQVMPEAKLIFIMPPNEEELANRLNKRGDTSAAQMKIRLDRARWEMDQSAWYDHVVTNDDADRCAEEILEIIADKA